MARFALERDIDFFNSISRELVDEVVDTLCMIYKLSVNDTKTNLYGESLSKWYKTGVPVPALIDRDQTETDDGDFGPDTVQNVEFKFNRFQLKEEEIYPEIGDIIGHNDTYFEIYNVRDDQYIGGRTGRLDPKERFSIVCQTTMVRRSRLNIENPLPDSPSIFDDTFDNTFG